MRKQDLASKWPRRPKTKRAAPYIRIDIGADAEMDGQISYLAHRVFAPSVVGPHAMSLLIPKGATRTGTVTLLRQLGRIAEQAWRGLQRDPVALTCFAHRVRKQVVAERRQKLSALRRNKQSIDGHPDLWTDERRERARGAMRFMAVGFMVKAGRADIGRVAAVTYPPKLARDVVTLAEGEAQLFANMLRAKAKGKAAA